MTGRESRPVVRLSIDPFATACGFAGLAAVLAWFDPYFAGLTLAIAALATLLWIVQVRGGPPSPRRSGSLGRVGAPMLFATGWGAWALGGLWSRGAGTLALGSAVVVAWWCARPRVVRRGRTR